MPKTKQSAVSAQRSEASRSDLALQYLRDAIESRKLSAGDEIDFVSLAKELGVSRTPIRESIRQLRTEGLLELLPGGRVCVVQLSLQEIEDYYAVRLGLEVAAVRAAALHISDYEIKILSINLELFDKHRNNPLTLRKIDNQFHNIIYKASRNSYMLQTLHRLRIMLGLVVGNPLEINTRIAKVRNEHAAIVKALKSHQPDLAEKAVTIHIRNAHASRLKWIGR